MALTIFCKLPADQRARAALVCRAWRDAVADPAAWTCLDLSAETGRLSVAVTDATLRAAAARAKGRLRQLYLENRNDLTTVARLGVVMANAGTLRDLSCLVPTVFHNIEYDEVNALARAAPQLMRFRVDAVASLEQAICMLRNDSPFEALMLRSLKVDATVDAAGEAVYVDDEHVEFVRLHPPD